MKVGVGADVSASAVSASCSDEGAVLHYFSGGYHWSLTSASAVSASCSDEGAVLHYFSRGQHWSLTQFNLS